MNFFRISQLEQVYRIKISRIPKSRAWYKVQEDHRKERCTTWGKSRIENTWHMTQSEADRLDSKPRLTIG